MLVTQSHTIMRLSRRCRHFTLPLGLLVLTVLLLQYFFSKPSIIECQPPSASSLIVRRRELINNNVRAGKHPLSPGKFLCSTLGPNKAREYMQAQNSSLIPLNQQPYVPTHKDLALTRPDLYVSQISRLLDSGYGTIPCLTEEGEEILWENGVEYRLYPYLESTKSLLWSSEFEPHVPFNPDVFFMGDKVKMELYESQMKRAESLRLGLEDTRKIILWWKDKTSAHPLPCLEPLRMCPDLPCLITSDRSYASRSAAMLINEQYIFHGPPARRPDQVMVMYQVEPPSTQHWYTGGSLDTPGWSDIFNWTMSYRLDSDISTFYGLIRKRRQPVHKNYTSILADKTGLVAWVVSNTNAMSDRIRYAEKLQQYLPLDILGSGGSYKCPRQKDRECTTKLARRYKFYLSFESAFCVNYITEKFYKYFNFDWIVVGRGTDEYSNIAPPGTFLNTADFPSPKELAERILYLDAHDDEYIKMLQKKDEYFAIYEDYLLADNVFSEFRYEAVSFCHLCHRLWNIDQYASTIADVKDWFYRGKCYHPHELYQSYKAN